MYIILTNVVGVPNNRGYFTSYADEIDRKHITDILYYIQYIQ